MRHESPIEQEGDDYEINYDEYDSNELDFS